MKSPLLLILFLLIVNNSFATIRLLNSANVGGEFSNFTAAQAAAVAGDTILVSGSVNTYGDIGIAKAITLMGTGHNPNKQNPLVSTFGNITISAGANVIGVYCAQIKFSALPTSAVTTIKRCNINNIVVGIASTSPNITIEGNIFRSSGSTADIDLTGLTGAFLINNNIFNYQISNISSANIFNNIFLGSGNAFTSTVAASSIENNIFYTISPNGQNTNCFTGFNCAYNGAGFITDNDGSNITSNPLFVNYSGGSFAYTNDFRLQAGSPCITNVGADGTQRGIYGGNPSLPFNQNGEPPIPVIRQMDVTPTSVPAGVPVNVNISITRKN